MQLSTYVQECLKDPKLELEARIINEIDEEKFKRLLNHFIGSKPKPKPVSTLDIRWDKDPKFRYTIDGEAAIKTYCQLGTIEEASITEKVPLPDKPHIIQSNLPIRWNLKREVEVESDPKNIPVYRDEKGTWRLKNRWSFFIKDWIRVDLTLVKQNSGTKFLPQKQHSYEVELEFIQKKSPKTKTMTPDKLTSQIETAAKEVLLVLEDLNVWMTSEEQNYILTEYLSCLYPGKKTRAEDARKYPLKYQPNRQPSTLEMKNVHELFEENAYTVTEKADGERMVGFILDSTLYLLNSRFDIINPNVDVPDKSKCILDGEWVNKEYYAFDMYMDQGNNLNSQTLPQRLAALKALGNTIKQKNFAPFAEFATFAEKKDYPYHIDGYIFTPNDPKRVTYKWKPPEENTIDFLVRFTQNPEAGLETCLVNLYVSMRAGNSLVDILVPPTIPSSQYLPELFARAEFPIRNGESILRCEDGSQISNDSIIECRYDGKSWVPMRLRRDKTALYKRHGNIRSTANARMTAISVQNSILNPVLFEYLTGEKPVPEKNTIVDDQDTYYEISCAREKNNTWEAISRFHNQVKREVLGNARIQSLSTKKGNHNIDNYKPSIWDISCGRAGDLSKWISNNYGKVVGTDLVEANLKDSQNGAYGRLRNLARGSGIPPILFFQLDAKAPWSKSLVESMTHSTKDMARLVWGLESPLDKHRELKTNFYNLALSKSIDVVSCQFSIHYFFESAQTLNQMLKNVVSLLRKGGVFVGTCMDGRKVFEMLHDKESIQGGDDENTIAWKITRGYLSQEFTSFGMAIQVYLKSTRQSLQEYLVDFQTLEETAKTHGLSLLQKQSFENYDGFYKLTTQEQAFSRLQSTFEFVLTEVI